jgi:hypothetical protein
LTNGSETTAATALGERRRREHPSMTPLIRNWRRFLPYLGGIAALFLFAGALVILHSHAQAYRPSEVRRALRTLQAWQPFAALGLAAASYLLLTLYDVLALRHVGRTLPYRHIASPPSPDMPSATRWDSGVSSARQYVTEFTRLWD